MPRFLSRILDNEKNQLLFLLSFLAPNSHILVVDSSEIPEYKLLVQSRTVRNRTVIASRNVKHFGSSCEEYKQGNVFFHATYNFP
jgi:hypothetical protein